MKSNFIKRISPFLGVFALGIFILGCGKGNENTGNKAKALLAKMTLEEKAAQMTQLTIEMISQDSQKVLLEPHQLDTAKLRKVIAEMNIGSILNVGGHTYAKEHWDEIHKAIAFYTKQSRLQIPLLYGIDAIHGVNYTLGSTLYPQQINIAATFNKKNAETMAKQTALGVRNSGINWNFSPVLDVARNPRWPRFWETFGEDPYVVSQLGVAMVNGYQQNEKLQELGVAACLKHYVGYGDARTGHDRTPAYIPERQLREIHLYPFQHAIDAGAKTIMINSGEVNGEPVHASEFLLTQVLRKELGFKGVTVTDWEDIKNLYERHKVAENYKEAIAMAINAGIDMAMVPLDLDFTRLLVENVKEGKVSEKRIDEAVLRILNLKFELGLFNESSIAVPAVNEKDNYAMALEMAHESMVLLKNDENTLPILSTERVLVSGVNADYVNALNGGWSHTWQGRETKYNNSVYTPLKALQMAIGKNVIYVPTASNATTSLNAAGVDKIVLFIGEDTYTEKPGDITSLELPEDQKALIRAAHKTGKPLIVVMIGGRPRTLPNEINLIKSFIWAGLPGDAGGEALANLLLGKVNFAGALPFTYPRYADFHHTYDHKYTETLTNEFKPGAFNPMFEFGTSLHYGQVTIETLELNNKELTASDSIKILVKVKNHGANACNKSVLIFIKDRVASITPPVKRLRAFDKVALQPGEEKEITLSVPAKALSFVDVNHKWKLEPGKFDLFVGEKQDSFIVIP